METVSYTHLDVYKRQAYKRVRHSHFDIVKAVNDNLCVEINYLHVFLPFEKYLCFCIRSK